VKFRSWLDELSVPKLVSPGGRKVIIALLLCSLNIRVMCWLASLHIHTSDPEMSPAKAEEDARGDCARRKTRSMEGI